MVEREASVWLRERGTREGRQREKLTRRERKTENEHGQQQKRVCQWTSGKEREWVWLGSDVEPTTASGPGTLAVQVVRERERERERERYGV